MNLLDPQGPVAKANSTILVDSVFIMLTIVVPTIIAILAFAYWFRESNPRARFQPEFAYSGQLELVVWSIPALTVILLGGVAWIGSHQLDPRAPVPGRPVPGMPLPGRTAPGRTVAGMTAPGMVPGTTVHGMTGPEPAAAPVPGEGVDAFDRCARQRGRAHRRLATSRAPLVRRWPVPGRVIPTQCN